METQNKWHIGQKVWDEVHFPGEEGKLVGIRGEEYWPYPLLVDFDGTCAEYGINGQLKMNCPQTLFPYPHKVVVEPIEEKPKLGDWGWFWNTNTGRMSFGQLVDLTFKEFYCGLTAFGKTTSSSWSHFSTVPPPHLVESLEKQGWEIRKIDNAKTD